MLISAGLISGVIMNYYNLPMFIWGAATASTFLDQTQYATVTSVVVDTYTLVQ